MPDQFDKRAEEIHDRWCRANLDHPTERAMLAQALREAVAASEAARVEAVKERDAALAEVAAMREALKKVARVARESVDFIEGGDKVLEAALNEADAALREAGR